jgi:hypothetical protein
MKRILFVCTGEHVPKGMLSFLQSLQEEEPVCVTGLFFCPLDYDLLASASHVPTASLYMQVRAKEISIVGKNKEIFKQECLDHHTRHHVHENDDRWNKDLFAIESRFSDVVVLSGELFCEDGGNGQPNYFLQEALHAAECPVMVVPEVYSPVRHLIVAYDGTKDSLFSIKQFCYLFPQLTGLAAEMVYVKDEESEHMPEIENIKSYSRLHFSSMGFNKLHFNASHYFAAWIEEKPSAMLITGSFGRSSFSYAAKTSFIKEVLRDHSMPIFIAHT